MSPRSLRSLSRTESSPLRVRKVPKATVLLQAVTIRMRIETLAGSWARTCLSPLSWHLALKCTNHCWHMEHMHRVCNSSRHPSPGPSLQGMCPSLQTLSQVPLW